MTLKGKRYQAYNDHEKHEYIVDISLLILCNWRLNQVEQFLAHHANYLPVFTDPFHTDNYVLPLSNCRNAPR